ncbi:hypothetical protein C8J35_104277 [Rhizobium sp. PP-F2F-G38]|nr:hypothetical protein C8J35_104277 [Rhizobium sp. PP-F2F-G38]
MPLLERSRCDHHYHHPHCPASTRSRSRRSGCGRPLPRGVSICPIPALWKRSRSSTVSGTGIPSCGRRQPAAARSLSAGFACARFLSRPAVRGAGSRCAGADGAGWAVPVDARFRRACRCRDLRELLGIPQAGPLHDRRIRANGCEDVGRKAARRIAVVRRHVDVRAARETRRHLAARPRMPTSVS